MKDVSANDLPAWFTTRAQGQSKSLANGSSSLQANQGDIRSFTIAKMTQKNHQDVHYLLAMHFYMTGASFVRIEEQHLLEAMQKLRPDTTVPLWKELAGKYLTKCYSNVKIKVDAWLAQGNYNCLTSDGWSNISNEAVINYMLVSTNMSLFLKSKYTGEQGHTASFLAKDMSRVIKATTGNIAGQSWTTHWQTSLRGNC